MSPGPPGGLRAQPVQRARRLSCMCGHLLGRVQMERNICHPYPYNSLSNTCESMLLHALLVDKIQTCKQIIDFTIFFPVRQLKICLPLIAITQDNMIFYTIQIGCQYSERLRLVSSEFLIFSFTSGSNGWPGPFPSPEEGRKEKRNI